MERFKALMSTAKRPEARASTPSTALAIAPEISTGVLKKRYPKNDSAEKRSDKALANQLWASLGSDKKRTKSRPIKG